MKPDPTARPNPDGNGGVAFFLPDAALADFNAEFLNEQMCRWWVLHRLHHRGVFCPPCSRQVCDGAQLQSFWSLKRIKCRDCSKFFSARSGTFLSGSHMDLTQVFLLTLLVAMGVENGLIAEILSCNPETVRLWRARFDSLGSPQPSRT